ncbi:MAG: sigma-54-dependent Fis family transcriptional regulator [Mesorhizobium sp.]|nr:GAF domain-containing protein [Mesorhizobium sp.]RUV73272.1 sigma-54-dependent Fis family transcriptional regulator [Mesorhizobium sp. M5C.F.Cr.IN.023.01.1.1]RWF86681.1 MAG: sigma-54-dependent Fis family transcriptional regulator [Mesorhizobium sp.]RWF95422.1 MAG: sigma-54-dependent Fis family transcriptional regulator [Mesorhizobium sp.]RWI40000.1 MAG: sigma-54-dependent Fis family transcriptional regulator [Mesorhizobium sp.]RWI45396.1 MAG: sigma-54-dependent Fis family transcriptional re
MAAIRSDEAAKSALVASWHRSSGLHRLDPAESKPPKRLTDAELNRARQSVELLIRTAQSSLDRLFLAVGGAGCCIVLANRNGVPVERRGAPGDDATFRDWGLWLGTLWGEESEGTNGIGTCLAEQRALTIHRDQHFLTRNTDLSCTTAPIFDHEGNLVAALDVSSCRNDLTESFVALISLVVADTVRRIEAEIFRIAFPNERILLAPVGERAAGALLAVDADDLVVGATRAARLALGIAQNGLAKPLPVSDLICGSAPLAQDLDEAERGAIKRALARADGNVSAAAANLGISRATLHRKLARLGLTRPH